MLAVAGLASPVGLDPTDVVFAWRVRDARRGAVQSGYRIVVSRLRTGAHATAPMVWDSGRVWSAANAFVPYRGPALAPDAVYRWQVQTWDGSGR
ncbi:MAG TPA: hypothetical protein VEP49_14135, partial [Acidimicrobiia bacterium]|nr:hypothetical protein [Acidimicrobiia bacterium]